MRVQSDRPLRNGGWLHRVANIASVPRRSEDSAGSTIAFANERAASEYLAQRLKPYFQLVPEVWLRHIDGSNLRVDYAALPRCGFHVDLVGIEVKHRYDDFRDFCHALKQAIDYRHSVITDARSTRYQGSELPFVFLWPPHHKANWAWGAERLAGQYNVGLIAEDRGPNGEEFFEFRVSGTPIWRSTTGVWGSSKFGAGRGRGSA